MIIISNLLMIWKTGGFFCILNRWNQVYCFKIDLCLPDTELQLETESARQ